MNNTIVDKLIKLKNGTSVLFSQGPQVKTDTDVFPYNRYFRGNHEASAPIIYSRQAGWRERHDRCYQEPRVEESKDYYPNHCFQAPPSTVYPCYPEYLRKYSDKTEMDIQLFKKNVLEYR